MSLDELTNSIIDKYYRSGSPLREVLTVHSEAVADFALQTAIRKSLVLEPEEIRAAAMLHDIGIFMTSAPSIHCMGTQPYIAHGILGARLLREEGAPEFLARVCERHTGSGLTAKEIIQQKLPLPPRDYLPETLLEKLICYSDKFFSKGGAKAKLAVPKPLEKVRKSMAGFGSDSLKRFDGFIELFL